MTIAQKIAELAEALGVDIPNDGQIADNLNAITLAKGGTITSNTNISEAIKNLANTIGGNDGGNTPAQNGLTEGVYFHYQHFNNWQQDQYNTVCGSIIIETAKHQDIFAGSYNKALPYGVGMLFHDGDLDKEKISIYGDIITYGDQHFEVLQPPKDGGVYQINEDYIHIPFGFDTNDSIYMDANGEQENKNYLDYIGSPLCIIIPFEVNNADISISPVKKIMFFDTILNINETPGM